MKTILISPDQIQWHELIQDMPCWASTSPEMSALAEDIQERGIDQPLIVCQVDGDDMYSLLDGRHRHRAAQAAGLGEVPVIVRPEEDAIGIIFSSITQRRHFGKGALAYLLYPVMCANVQPKEKNLLRGPKSTQSTSGKSSIESTIILDLCVRAGFSRDLYFQAKTLHEAFDKRPDLREDYEPRILTGEIGLGACIAGMAGKVSTEGKHRQDSSPKQLIEQAFESIQIRFRFWEKLEVDDRRDVQDRAIETVLQLPEEVQESIARAIRLSRKEARA